MASPATLYPADPQKLDKLRSHVSGLNQISDNEKSGFINLVERTCRTCECQRHIGTQSGGNGSGHLPMVAGFLSIPTVSSSNFSESTWLGGAKACKALHRLLGRKKGVMLRCGSYICPVQGYNRPEQVSAGSRISMRCCVPVNTALRPFVHSDSF